jgi:hypothetical protein
MHFILLVMFIAQISASFLSQIHACACFITTFVVEFHVISRRISLVYWVSIKFQSRVLRFYSTDGTSG